MKHLCLLMLLHALVLSSGCSPSPETRRPPEPAPALSQAAEDRIRSQGKAVASQTFQALSARLKQAIEEGGVTSAVPYCSTVAVPLTTAIAATNGVSVRRVSHKPRNPAAAANPFELEWTRRYQSTLTNGEPLAPIVQPLADGGALFYAPIVITNDLCLKCHGQIDKELSLEVLLAIRQKYPQDQAIGFKLGDLRGLWRIEFPASLVKGAAGN